MIRKLHKKKSRLNKKKWPISINVFVFLSRTCMKVYCYDFSQHIIYISIKKTVF